MKRWLALVMLCVAASDAQAAAQRTPFQIRCEDTISKSVSVLKAKQEGYTINNQLPYRALTARTGSSNRGMQTLGLTVTQGLHKASVGGPILQDRQSGYECIAPKVDIQLYYSPVRIYVGNEFVPGTCAYKEILDHEMRHLKAHMDNLARVQKVVGDALNKRFAGQPMYAPSGTAMSALQHEIGSTWFNFIRDEFEKGKADQEKIDSPQEYARLGKACNGEIAQILTRRRK
ncbi:MULTISPECIES: hypothetical protein [unclassified Duganella]|uniref:hypothetical protein n=1 Tax=unclassified Duganella TaxID=2636909 RepID=UPI000887A482|nr:MULTISPECIES: hypothetical protein [unclassified Duganella]SDF49507.1 hypothetical protein SAMN05216320_101377 [Duganella sp. OV458]SDI77488.1 hypothetical protein SAMN05428973_1011045 [Duganella sp. OV510]